MSIPIRPELLRPLLSRWPSLVLLGAAPAYAGSVSVTRANGRTREFGGGAGGSATANVKE